MIPGKDARRSNFFDAELDALVAREVDALALRQARTSPKTRAPLEGAAHEIEGEILESLTHRPSPDNVIGIRHGGRSGGTDVLAFSAEEEAFIEHAVAFLRERPNADVIIEEMWHHTVLDRHDNDQRLECETQVVDEPAVPADDEPTDEEIPPADPEKTAADDNRVMPLQRSMTKTRAHGGTGGETVPAKSAESSSPSGKQKRDNDGREEE